MRQKIAGGKLSLSRTQKRRTQALVVRLLLIAGLLILWEFMVRSGRLSSFYTSYPSEIAADLWEVYTSGDLYQHASITLREAFTGLFYGTIIGVAVGVVFGQFTFLGHVLKPIITAIYGIPQLTLAPVYILWFGIGLQSKIFLAGLMAFFNIFFATYGAIQDMEPKLIESAHLLGANRLQTLLRVVLPTCTPWIMSGFRSALGSSLIGAIVGEYMGAAAGFGWMVAYATSYFRMKRVMSCIVILLLVGLILNFVLDKIESLLLKWRPATTLNVGADRESA